VRFLQALVLGVFLTILYMFYSVSAAYGYTPSPELRLMHPTKLTMEHYKVANNRDEYLHINDPGSTKYGDSSEHWVYGSAVDIDFDLISYGNYALYWQNHVHMAATNVAVRHVGWEFETGARAGKHLDFFYYHHSEHLMDMERGARRFPLVNYYGVRFVLIQEGRK
jgi:hypothetical protein